MLTVCFLYKKNLFADGGVKHDEIKEQQNTSTSLAIVETLPSSDDEAPEEIPVMKSVEKPEPITKTENNLKDNSSSTLEKLNQPKQSNKREKHPKQDKKAKMQQQNCVNQAKNIKRKYTLLQRVINLKN